MNADDVIVDVRTPRSRDLAFTPATTPAKAFESCSATHPGVVRR